MLILKITILTLIKGRTKKASRQKSATRNVREDPPLRSSVILYAGAAKLMAQKVRLISTERSRSTTALKMRLAPKRTQKVCSAPSP